jgi:hypothetical protein
MTKYIFSIIITICFLTSSCKQSSKENVSNQEQSTNAASQFHNTSALQQDTSLAKYSSKKKLSCCKGAPSRFRQVAGTEKKL